MTHNNNKNGFTLIELILFMGIFSILLYMITNIFVTTLDAKRESESYSGITQDGTYILNRLQYDIARAETITTPLTLGEQTSTLQMTIDGVTNTYALDNDNLILVVGEESLALNGYDTTVTNLTFRRLGNANGKNSIQVSYQLTSKTNTRQGFRQRVFTSTFGTR